MTTEYCIKEDSKFDLEKMIDHGAIKTVFHPICSLASQRIIGFEALSRGIWKDEVISPLKIFNEAQLIGKELELDRLCRAKALSAFSENFRNSNHLLFLNINTAVLTKATVGSNIFNTVVAQAGIDAERIVIEILESETKDEKYLLKFVDHYRKLGFKIALDDVGMGSSNLNRIAILRPSVVKIDRFLIKNIHKEHYKRAVARGLIDIAHEVGAIVVAEGVENETEAVACLEEGADSIQGFYFTEPKAETKEVIEICDEKIIKLTEQYRSYSITALNKKKKRTFDQNRIFSYLTSMLQQEVDLEKVESLFDETSVKSSKLECFYILDLNGIQLSSTIGIKKKQRGNSIFGPAEKGTDHGMKRYYISLASGLKKYISDPYLSFATGKICQTLAGFFLRGGQEYILCADFSYE
ncbi:MAG: EAL domain-containing protein [Chitinispirillaceae bacterium]